MYSPSVIEANIARITDRMRAAGNSRFQIHRFPEDIIQEMTEHLDSLYDKETGGFTRDLTREEQTFIQNELILCQIDARHFMESYCIIELASQYDKPEGWGELEAADAAMYGGSGSGAAAGGSSKSGGPLGRFLLNGMQLDLLKRLGELEDIAWAQYRAGAPVNGILLIILKARQLGASAFWQAAIRHRVNFYSHYNALVASIDDQATQALQRRSDRIYDHMPPWMRTAIKHQTKDRGIVFANGSVIELQDGKQNKDLGKGETWHAGHITECSVFERPHDHFDEGLFPAIPHSLRTFVGMESTAKGKIGWWFDFCSNVMSGTAEGGAGRFSFYFAPFYLIDISESARGQRSKYRLDPPPDWEPSPQTQLMAQRAYDTSPAYTGGRHVTLAREVLCWYESTRSMYFKKGLLNIFLQSYPIEPREAFQHSAAGAFTVETIERLDNNCAKYAPWPYRLMTEDELPLVELYSKQPVHHVAGYHLGPMHDAELDRDSRGIVYLFEQPHPGLQYFLGCDPTGGIPKWQRAFRSQDDINTDNGAIAIYRKGRSTTTCEDCRGLGWLATKQAGVTIECATCDGRGRLGGRGVQVAEFAAPIDSEELALYAFILGRLFRGDSEHDECLAIVENNNTGIVTIRKLQNTYQYSSLYQHQTLDGFTPKFMNSLGFHSSPQSVPVLHARSRILVVRRDVEIRSHHLVKELSDAVIKISEDSGRERFHVPPGGGRHDDRMTASFLAWWAMFKMTETGDSESPADAMRRDLPPARDYARTDASAADQQAAWNAAVETMLGDFDLYFGHYPDCAPDCASKHAVDDFDSELDDAELAFDDTFTEY